MSSITNNETTFAAVCGTRTAKKSNDLNALKAWAEANYDSDIVIWKAAVVNDKGDIGNRIVSVWTATGNTTGGRDWIDM